MGVAWELDVHTCNRPTFKWLWFKHWLSFGLAVVKGSWLPTCFRHGSFHEAVYQYSLGCSPVHVFCKMQETLLPRWPIPERAKFGSQLVVKETRGGQLLSALPGLVNSRPLTLSSGLSFFLLPHCPSSFGPTPP